jgi:hypothetical protein
MIVSFSDVPLLGQRSGVPQADYVVIIVARRDVHHPSKVNPKAAECLPVESGNELPEWIA